MKNLSGVESQIRSTEHLHMHNTLNMAMPLRSNFSTLTDFQGKQQYWYEYSGKPWYKIAVFFTYYTPGQFNINLNQERTAGQIPTHIPMACTQAKKDRDLAFKLAWK